MHHLSSCVLFLQFKLSSMNVKNIWLVLLALSFGVFVDLVLSKSIASQCPRNQYYSPSIEDCTSCANICGKQTPECVELCPGSACIMYSVLICLFDVYRTGFSLQFFYSILTAGLETVYIVGVFMPLYEAV